MSEPHVLVAGEAGGTALVLTEALSFWGGVDERTGMIVDQHHPQRGESLAGRIVVVSRTRGSTSSSGVLAEIVRAGVGPAALLLAEPDPAVVAALTVVGELYGIRVPAIVLASEQLSAIRDGQQLQVRRDGAIAAAVDPDTQPRR